MSKIKDGYYYVGGMLRDELIKDIDAHGWKDEDEDATRAAKVKASLQLAAPHRGGYLFDVHDWDWEDSDFLKAILIGVEEDFGHIGSSRGFAIGHTPFGRQIRALREKL